jgi:hypothetical protein
MGDERQAVVVRLLFVAVFALRRAVALPGFGLAAATRDEQREGD